MRYMLLIYDREVDWARLAEKDKGLLYQEYGAFTEGIKKAIRSSPRPRPQRCACATARP